MVYVSVIVLVVCVGWIAVCSCCQRKKLRELYHMRGIYRILYPPSLMIYRLLFKKKASKRRDIFLKLYPAEDSEKLLEERYLKNISHALLILITVNTAVLALYIGDSGSRQLTDALYIERQGQGEGSKTVDLTAQAGDIREDVCVVVGEKRLPEEQMETLKAQCQSYILEHVAGENESLEHVTRKLDFFSEIPQYSVQVRWEASDYLIVGMDGTVKNEELEKRVPVQITAFCSYFDMSWACEVDIVVEPAVQDAQTQLKLALDEALASQEQLTAGDDYMKLPDRVEGVPVSWSERPDSSPEILLGLGGMVIALIFARENERAARALKGRNAQLFADYPVFVHKVVLLLGTGMTSKAAWFRIISDYHRNLREGGEKRFVYEEMIVAANEMKQGITEAEAYDHFGHRCGTSQYLKFCSILIQSVKTGAGGMGRMLAEAGEEAVIVRRENAKRVGEEAGTKLLFPMIVLLGVVMFIVIVPAFMSMGL